MTVLSDSVTPESSPKLFEPASDDPVCLAISISERVYNQADLVIVANLANLDETAVAAQLAVMYTVPLLYYHPEGEDVLSAELQRLGASEVWTMAGVPETVAPSGTATQMVSPDLVHLITWMNSLQASPLDEATSPEQPTSRTILGRLLVPFSALWSTPPRSGPEDDNNGGGLARRLWLIDPEDGDSALVVATAALRGGDSVVPWNPDQPSGWEAAGWAIEQHARGGDEIWITGEQTPTARWFVETSLWGEELPGGGHILFPHRRLVAFYGAVTTHKLGVLGEQDAPATLERMQPFLEDYAADGVMTIPTFEIITTLATGSPGPDGDYSGEYKIETLLPWVDFAAENGIYVVLDLQPGRTDFLVHAKQYEELLRRPHVGLALDPEWRLGPNEKHLVQIGSVSAAEVNRVIDWLAALVRRERLPQKLLIVHQFRLDMITNRSTLKTPPELAVLIHMDGQGSLGSKYSTWGVLTRGTQDRGWWWGWKNFFDEDFPLARPDQVLELQPVNYFISFQ